MQKLRQPLPQLLQQQKHLTTYWRPQLQVNGVLPGLAAKQAFGCLFVPELCLVCVHAWPDLLGPQGPSYSLGSCGF